MRLSTIAPFLPPKPARGAPGLLAAARRSPAVALLEAFSLICAVSAPIIWVNGWLQWWLAIPLTILLLFGFGEAWRFGVTVPPEADSDAQQNDSAPTPRGWLALQASGIVLLVAGLVACTGMGAVGFPFFDATLVAGVMKDCLTIAWPVGYEYVGADGSVRQFAPAYYLGFHMVPSLVGMVLPWPLFYRAHYFWIVVCVLLTVIWYLRTVRQRSLFLAAVFLCFGGLDILGHVFTARYGAVPDTSVWDYVTGVYPWSIGRGWLDHWHASFAITEGAAFMNGVFHKWYAPLSTLVDGINHAVPVWIPLMMILYDTFVRRRCDRLFFLAALVPISSLLCAIGLLPLLGVALIHNRGRGALSVANLVPGPPLVLVLFLYFMSGGAGFDAGWLWEFQDVSQSWPYLLLFYVAEFGLLALVMPRAANAAHLNTRLWMTAALLIFLLVPLYRFGLFNDQYRLMIPWQFAFLVLIGHAWARPAAGLVHTTRWGIMTCLLLVGMWGSAGVVARSLEYGLWHPTPPKQQIRGGVERLPTDYLEQIPTGVHGLFWEHLAKEPSRYTPPPIPVATSWNFAGSSPSGDEWQLEAGMAKRTEAGIQVDASQSGYIMRLDNVDLHARDIGTIFAEIQGLSDTAEDAEFALVLQWASPEEAAAASRDPLHVRWHSHIVYPLYRSVYGNAYWEGRIASLALYLDLRKPSSMDGAALLLTRLTCLER